jgi:TRAP-type transport system small permease protein
VTAAPAAFLRAAYGRVCAAEARIAAVFLVAMVVLIFAGGVSRVFGYPLNWSTDAATCLFAWACFLCADIAWRRNGLMSIELVTTRLPPRGQRVLRMLNLGVIAAFLGYFVVLGVWLAWTSRVRSFQGIPEISYSWVTASLPFGALLLLITTLLKLRDEARGGAPSYGGSSDVL